MPARNSSPPCRLICPHLPRSSCLSGSSSAGDAQRLRASCWAAPCVTASLVACECKYNVSAQLAKATSRHFFRALLHSQCLGLMFCCTVRFRISIRQHWGISFRTWQHWPHVVLINYYVSYTQSCGISSGL